MSFISWKNSICHLISDYFVKNESKELNVNFDTKASLFYQQISHIIF